MGRTTLNLPDWPFGAMGRRLLLDALLRQERAVQGWSQSQLESELGLSNGALAPHLPGAVDLGLAVVRNGLVHGAGDGELGCALRDVLDAVDSLPDRAPRPLTRRAYVRRG